MSCFTLHVGNRIHQPFFHTKHRSPTSYFPRQGSMFDVMIRNLQGNVFWCFFVQRQQPATNPRSHRAADGGVPSRFWPTVLQCADAQLEMRFRVSKGNLDLKQHDSCQRIYGQNNQNRVCGTTRHCPVFCCLFVQQVGRKSWGKGTLAGTFTKCWWVSKSQRC